MSVYLCQLLNLSLQDEHTTYEKFLQFCEMFYCEEVVSSVVIYSVEQWGLQDILDSLLYDFQS